MLGWDVVIAQLRAGVEATPKNHPDRPIWLGNLGSAYRGRYEQTKSCEYLEAAISMSEEALRATSGGHRSRARWLRYLAIDLQDLEIVVDGIPHNHPDRGARLATLGAHLSRRYERTRGQQDLEAAIARSEAAVEAT